MFILISVFLLAFTVLSLKNYRLACLLAIAMFPAYLIRFNILMLPSTLLEGMIMILAVVWFARDGRKIILARFAPTRNKSIQLINYPFKWEIIALMALMAYLIITALIALLGDHGGMDLRALGIIKAYFLEPIVLFIVLMNTFREKYDWQKIAGALAISAGAISLVAIFQKITGLLIANPFWAAAATRRATSFFEYPNAVGLFLAPIIPLLITWLLAPEPKKSLRLKIFIAGDIILSIIAIWAAKSEGALIGLAAGLFLAALFLNKRIRALAISLAIIFLAAVALISPLRQFAWEKISLNDLSGQIRCQQWKETIIVLRDGHMIGGLGINAYQAAIKPIHQEGIFFNRDRLENFDSLLRSSSEMRDKYWQPVEVYLYPHNILLNFWTELGLFGALLFAWLILRFLFQAAMAAIKSTSQEEHYFALGLFASMLTIAIHGLVDVPYFKNDLSAFFWLLFALLGGLIIRQKNTSKKSQ